MNLICPKCGNKVNPNTKRPQCGKCKYSFPRNKSATTQQKVSQISADFMQGSLIEALKKTGLDPMKKGQIRDAISSLLEKDEYKIAWADALEEKKIDSIRLAKRILIDWLKKEGYV